VTGAPAGRLRLTADSLLHGRLVLHQPARGHRANLDAVLLAAFAATSRAPAARAAVDLGAGTGVVALLLRHAGIVDRCLCVEAEAALAEVARRNAAANRMEDAVDVLRHDLREPLPARLAATFVLALANPPYLPLAAGHVSPDPLRAAARHEIRGGLPVFLAAARFLLAPGATLALVYPWTRHAHAREALARAGFALVRERRHLPRRGAPPTTVCFEARAGAPRANGAPPAVERLVVHRPGGGFSPRVERFLAGDYASRRRMRSSSIAPARTIR
jgi:tRNA1(Val) A37 N6-methylase TrmN6